MSNHLPKSARGYTEAALKMSIKMAQITKTRGESYFVYISV
jgi:hypothetical protein